jgi:mycofactocin precursor
MVDRNESAENTVTASQLVEETLVEEVFIDGMCGVY